MAVDVETDLDQDGGKGEETFTKLQNFIQRFYPGIEEDEKMMPKFKLQQGIKKYGNGTQRVEDR
eukprot:6109655-Ditylum_brightwellii.AAC.1